MTDRDTPVGPTADGQEPLIEQVLLALDGQLGAAEQAALEARLAGDVGERRQFVQICLQSSALSEVLGVQRRDAGPDVAALPGEGASIRRPAQRVRQFGARVARGRPWLPWSITAAACIIAAISLSARRDRTETAVSTPAADTTPRPATVVPPANADAVIAVLVNEADARFAGKAAPQSVRFGAGAYHLTSGMVHLRFTSGADVVIRAPARYMIHDPLHIALTEGTLRAIVPDSAHGFTVEAPGVDYEDLGTEFGVTAVAGRSESVLQVFEGRVDLKTPRGKRITQATLGESVRVVNGEVEPKTPADLDRFPTPGSIGLERWNRWRESFATDPSLVCYYPFLEDTKDDRLLRDHAAHGQAVHGRVRGARWVSGRWPGKQALLFDRDEDAVELTLPGDFRQLTMAAWVNIDRFEFALNAILDSDGWGPGSFHWQLTRLGEQHAGIYEYWRLTHSNEQHAGADELKRQKKGGAGSLLPVGQWVHLAATVDLDRSVIRVFANGELCEEETSLRPHPELTLNTGRCRMGNWLRSVEWPYIPKRGLRGRIDEFAVWRRALSQDEIRQHAKVGWPSLLYAVGPAEKSW